MNVATNKFLELTSGIKVPPLVKSLIFNRKIVFTILLTVASAYIGAVVTSSVLVSTMLGSLAKQKSAQPQTPPSANLPNPKSPNYVSIRVAVMNRNLFNAQGEFPPEEEEEETEVKSDGKAFDMKAKCQKPSLKLNLLGTIYMGNSGGSLATIREEGFDEADIYKVGDVLIGTENAVVVAIERKKIIINNNGVKECLEVFEKELVRESNEYVDKNTAAKALNDAAGGEEAAGACVTLQSSFVEQELGDGFSKIVNAARLVPNMEENQVVGFKIFAILTSSILGKAGLKNNDIITQVNEVSLKQPEQGFALYEAFQNEREINIHVLRGGNTPRTLCVKIK